ncbi:hypothetical protein D3C79_972140 [compost metagenome]
MELAAGQLIEHGVLGNGSYTNPIHRHAYDRGQRGVREKPYLVKPFAIKHVFELPVRACVPRVRDHGVGCDLFERQRLIAQF